MASFLYTGWHGLWDSTLQEPGQQACSRRPVVSIPSLPGHCSDGNAPQLPMQSMLTQQLNAAAILRSRPAVRSHGTLSREPRHVRGQGLDNPRRREAVLQCLKGTQVHFLTA